MTPSADQEGKLQFLPFPIEAMNFSFRLSNSRVRFNDSSAESFALGGRSILISLISFNLLAISRSVPTINPCCPCIVAQQGNFASVGLTPAFSGAASGLTRMHEKLA